MDKLEELFESFSSAVGFAGNTGLGLARAAAALAAFGRFQEVGDVLPNTVKERYLQRWKIKRDQSARVVETLRVARKVRHFAYAPYSRLTVGAAVLSKSGEIAAGVNIENCSYGLTLCAERHALATARVQHIGPILVVCVVTDTTEPVTPCGACRQWMAEMSPSALVVMATVRTKQWWRTVDELLPLPFHATSLHSHTLHSYSG